MGEEERVISLLSSLPDRFSTLVTALEANEKIPSWDVVTERLLNEERKQRGGRGTSDSSKKLLFLKQLELFCLTQSSPKHSGLKLSQLLCMLKIGALLVLIKFDSFPGYE
ncbi:hypothetical protein FHG87_022111 [Trinorchestia longiramus]|nr:hypothetical protein FHG87_022111 [Trinorchestia longiramus]